MPTNRFQFSDDFTLNNGNVGINSATPQTKLDVVGVVKGDSLKVTGVSSFTTYEGFLNSNQNIVENTTISGGGISGSLSGEIIVGTGITVTVASGTTSSQGNIDSLKVYNTFTVPVGGTADRPPKPTPGQLFFNRDFATMEFWDGDRWRQVDNTTQRGRGVFNLGFSPATTQIDFINISSTGNAQDFGNTSIVRGIPGSCSSSIRGLFSSGYTPGGNTNSIDYITIASQGNAIDFGDGTIIREELSGCSSSTRGLFAGGGPSGSAVNTIDYVTITSIGNAIDFGDLTIGRSDPTGISSPTRAVICGGAAPGPSLQRTMDTFNISSTGNAVSFGNLTETFSRGSNGSISSGTRGIVGGGNSPSIRNIIEYITFSTFGNAQDFGDLTLVRARLGSTSNITRGIFSGGNNPSQNIIDYITIASTGNAQDFGDLTRVGEGLSGLSDSHGGLGGF